MRALGFCLCFAMLIGAFGAEAPPAPAAGLPAATSAPPPSAAPAETPAAASPETAPSQELQGVQVHGKLDPLAERDRRLHELQNGLPDLGGAPKAKEKDRIGKLARKGAKQFQLADPNDLSPDQKRQLGDLIGQVRDPGAAPGADDSSDHYTPPAGDRAPDPLPP